MSKLSEQFDLNRIETLDQLIEELQKIFVDFDLVGEVADDDSSGDNKVTFKNLENSRLSAYDGVAYNAFGLPDRIDFTADSKQGNITIDYDGYKVSAFNMEYPNGTRFAQWDVSWKSDGLRVDSVDLDLFQD